MSQADDPTLDQFIELISERLLGSGATSARFDDSVGMLAVSVVDGEREARLDLDVIRLHRRYVQDLAKRREEVLAGAVEALRLAQTGMRELLPDSSKFVPRIETPLSVFLRERSGPNAVVLPDGEPDEPIWEVDRIEEFVGDLKTPHRGVGPYLVATLGFEMDSLSGYVDATLLEAEGFSFDEALEAAYARLGTTTPQFATLLDGVLFAAWQDGRNECRLLEPRVFEQLKLKGDPVVCVPSEGVVYVAGSKDIEGLRTLAKAVQTDYRSASAKLCPKPILLQDGEWITFDPPYDQAPEFHTLEALWASYQGNRQQSWMTSVNFERGPGWFPAGVTMLGVDDSDTLHSHTLWQEPLVTLLPKAEYVSFFTERMQMCSPVPWDRVFAATGEPQQVRGFDPPRFVVQPGMFPSPELLAELGSVCVDLPPNALDDDAGPAESGEPVEPADPFDLEDPEQFEAFLEALRAAVEGPPGSNDG